MPNANPDDKCQCGHDRRHHTATNGNRMVLGPGQGRCIACVKCQVPGHDPHAAEYCDCPAFADPHRCELCGTPIDPEAIVCNACALVAPPSITGRYTTTRGTEQ